MSARLHTTPIYHIEYGDTISSLLTSSIYDIFYKAETGYINESETELEIDRWELEEIRKNDDMSDELKKVIDQILKESDPDNNFIHLSLF